MSKAQQFWVENWTGGSGAQGTLTYTGPNGAWAIQQTGANGADSNAWYFSNEEQGLGRGGCGTATGSSPSAHMGNTASAPILGFGGADNGAIIDDWTSGGTNTNLRLQSPVINCTGKTTITLSFNYIMGNAAGNDYATVDYFDGTSWTLLSSPAATGTCGGGQGTWTYYSVALPASANNNANVKVGFNWTNNSTGYDDLNSPEVSFAVDSVVLSTPVAGSPPVAAFGPSDTTLCVGDSVTFIDMSTNSPTSWKWTFENGTPATSTLQNPVVKYNTAGVDSVKLVVRNASGSDSVTVKTEVTVSNCGAGVVAISSDNNISLYPNPAENTINLEFDKAINESAKVEITDITGRLISTQVFNAFAGKIISMDISGMTTGVYIIKVSTDSKIYYDKFIKQ